MTIKQLLNTLDDLIEKNRGSFRVMAYEPNTGKLLYVTGLSYNLPLGCFVVETRPWRQ